MTTRKSLHARCRNRAPAGTGVRVPTEVREAALEAEKRWTGVRKAKVGRNTRAKVSAGTGLGAMIIAMSMCWSLASPAQADETIPIQWDGPTMNVSWNGDSYATSTGSIVGSVVAVPGDRAERTAVVRNGGPSPARTTVQILNVTTTNAPDTVNGDLEDLVHLFWDVGGVAVDRTWREVREDRDPNGVSYSISFHMSQGEKFRVTAGYYFPGAATTGNAEGFPSSELSFDVRILMQGDDHVKVDTGGSAEGHHGGVHLAVWMIVVGIVWLIPARMSRRPL